jgi:anti-sigma regulatory factor (Ser/Thr protein kinase)
MSHVERPSDDSLESGIAACVDEGAAGVDLYRFVRSERTEVSLSCRECLLFDSFELPIIERLVAGGLLDEGEGLRLKVGVQEAVVNGCEHGCLELQSEWKDEIQPDGRDKFSAIRAERLADPDYARRRVTVCSWFDGENVEISVRDDGQGFLSGPVSGGEKAVTSVSCAGRGLALMANAADEVKFSRNGAEVILTKRLRRQWS